MGPEVIEAVDAYLTSRRDRLGSYGLPTSCSCAPTVGPSQGERSTTSSPPGPDGQGSLPPPGSLAHALRHTYATLLVDNGASLPERQRLLGHRDLSTTQVYLAVTRSSLEQTAMVNPARALLRKVAPLPRFDPAADQGAAPPS